MGLCTNKKIEIHLFLCNVTLDDEWPYLSYSVLPVRPHQRKVLDGSYVSQRW